MSLFGDGSFKQEVYDSFHYIIHNLNPEVSEREEHLKFLHENIFYIINGNYESVNEYVLKFARERNMNYKEVCKHLGEIYVTIIEWDILTKMNENDLV